MKENLSIGLRLSLHRLLLRLHRYCASTLTATNALIIERLFQSLSFSIQLRYFFR